MHPVLVKIGAFQVYSYGFMLAMSFLAGIYVATWRAKRFGVNPQYILDISVWIILSAVVGSRLTYVIFHLDEYSSFVDVFALWEGGATLYGGLVFAIVASVIFAQRKNIKFLQLADIISPSIALGIMFTRVGCFLSGCCFGRATTSPLGLVFPPESGAGYYSRHLAENASETLAVHPTQLYSSLFGLATFAILLLLEKKLTKRGATFGLLLMMYSVFRFSIDFVRIYESNMLVVEGFTYNQLISIPLFFVGLFFVVRKTSQPAKIAAA